MRKRILYGGGIVLLAILVALVVWQGSFNFGKYGPADPQQTFIFWAISSLIFVLMVTLGFMLVRTVVKLYVDRRSGREGSRIQTKLVLGALALSLTPALFLVLFSYEVLNRNLDKWFSQPAEASHQTFVQISETLENELRDEAALQAALLAAQPETRLLLEKGVKTPGFLQSFAKDQDLAAAAIIPVTGDTPLDSIGPVPIQPSRDNQTVIASHAVEIDGALKGTVELASRVPIDITEKQREIDKSDRAFKELAASRRNVRTFYLLFMAMITLFVLFVATWIALFLSKQISVPITALLHAAGEVSKGNLKHRVEVRAIDELASLVRGFNEMTQRAGSQQPRTGRAPAVHRGDPGKHSHRSHLHRRRWLHPARQSRAEPHVSRRAVGHRDSPGGSVLARRHRRDQVPDEASAAHGPGVAPVGDAE